MVIVTFGTMVTIQFTRTGKRKFVTSCQQLTTNSPLERLATVHQCHRQDRQTGQDRTDRQTTV